MESAIDLGFTAQALIADARLTNDDILNAELERARHALAYLKGKISNDAMRDLLANDLAEMTARVRGWVQESEGAWQTGSVELILPGPSAAAFRAWYAEAMANQWEERLRAGHPEHFINHPRADAIEVVENVGETALPWHIFYRSLPEDAAYPSPWDDRYSIHFGAEILDRDGLRVGFSMRELRDDADGLHMKLTSHLPAAAPSGLLRRHLTHFSIEYRNWARFARAKDGQPSPSQAANPSPWDQRVRQQEACAGRVADLPILQEDHAMDISRFADHTTAIGKPEWFTGAVWNETLAVGQPPSRLHVARVTFAPGARTRWHTHPHGQILLAVSGMGRVQKDGEPVRALGPGDTVSIAAGERHWHGAAPGHLFVHVAMQEAGPDGQQADWLEPVADDAYVRAPE